MEGFPKLGKGRVEGQAAVWGLCPALGISNDNESCGKERTSHWTFSSLLASTMFLVNVDM